MAGPRRFAWLCLVSALVLFAGPGVGLYAASPCHAGAPMTCCAEDGGGEPVPCGCSLSPVAPAPGVVDAAAPGPAPAAEPVLLFEMAPDAPAATPASSVVPTARAAPLFVLFASFLN